MSLNEALAKIKNAKFGKEVRPAIHDGLLRANEISDGAFEAVSDNVDRQVKLETQVTDMFLEMTDKDVVSAPEIIEARGNELKLGFRIDKFENNLSVLGINVTSLGIDKTGVNDITPHFSSFENGNTYLFPVGDYLIDSHAVVSGLDNVTFSFADGAKLIDSFGVEVGLTGGGAAQVPNGIRFENCKNLKFEKLPVFNPRGVQGEIIEEDRSKRKPNFDFIDCPNLELDCVVDGLAGSWTKLDYDLGALDFMSSSIIRAYHCSNIKLTGELLDDSGVGEIFSFFQCPNADVRDLKHKQSDGKRSFWSLGKFIQCDNLNIENIVDIKSGSSGSLFDVSGSKMRFKNIKPDYPNGLPFDITHEWGLDSGPSKVVFMDELVLNGRGAYETNPPVGVSDSYKKSVDELCEIDTVHLKNSILNMTGGMAILNDRTSNVFLENVEIYDAVRFNHSQTLSSNTATRRRNLYADNVYVKSNSATNHMDANGDFEMNNSTIDIDGGTLHLMDRYAQQYLTLLSSSPYTMRFTNVKFINATIYFNSNVHFTNCEFIDCRFLTNNNVTSSPIITFSGSDIKITITGLVSNKSIFDLTRGLSKLTLDNTRISGRYENTAGHTLFTNFTQGEVEIKNGSVIDVERNANGIPRAQQLSVVFSAPNGRNVKIVVDNSNIKGVLVQLTGGTETGSTVIKVKNSTISKRAGDTDVEFPIRALHGGNYNKVWLSVTNNSFADANMTTTTDRITTGGGSIKTEYNSFSDVV